MTRSIAYPFVVESCPKGVHGGQYALPHFGSKAFVSYRAFIHDFEWETLPWEERWRRSAW